MSLDTELYKDLNNGQLPDRWSGRFLPDHQLGLFEFLFREAFRTGNLTDTSASLSSVAEDLGKEAEIINAVDDCIKDSDNTNWSSLVEIDGIVSKEANKTGRHPLEVMGSVFIYSIGVWMDPSKFLMITPSHRYNLVSPNLLFGEIDYSGAFNSKGVILSRMNGSWLCASRPNGPPNLTEEELDMLGNLYDVVNSNVTSVSSTEKAKEIIQSKKEIDEL